MITKLQECRYELNTALEELASERVKVDRANKQLDVERQRADLAVRRAQRVFERHDFEAMTREQLVSFAEGAINEARRKGLIEAEGLATRQLKLSRETDLDLMRGVVKEYQGRIAEVEAELKANEQAQKKFEADTRPLSAKLETAQPAAFKSPTWWNATSVTAYKPNAAEEAAKIRSGFIPFDQRAAAITAAAKAKEPHVLNDGDSKLVPGSTDGGYILARKGNVYSCTCPAWYWNSEPVERRTCKHLEKYLGEKAEADRISSPPKCHCGNPLVRGQCPTHTRDWKGPEECSCGRSFASCKAAYDTISVAQRRFGHQPALTTVDGATYVYAVK